MEREKFSQQPKENITEKFDDLKIAIKNYKEGTFDKKLIKEKLSDQDFLNDVKNKFGHSIVFKIMGHINEDARAVWEEENYQTGQIVMEEFHRETAPAIRKIMKKRFGIEKADLEGFDSQKIAKTYFQIVYFLEGSWTDRGVGNVLKRPLSKFEGKTPLDYIRENKYEAVYDHALSYVYGQIAT